MSKHRILVFTGLWVMILPFLGFPRGFKNILFVLTGLLLIFFAYVFKRRKRIQRIRKSEERVLANQEQDSAQNEDSEDVPTENEEADLEK